MNKIKDIIYDFNDLFIVLLIVALTAGVLFWRVDRIMAYPEYLAKNQEEQQDLDYNLEGIDLKPEEVLTGVNDNPEEMEADWENITSDPAIGDANEGDVGDGTQPAPQGEITPPEVLQPAEGQQGEAQTGGENQGDAQQGEAQTGDSQKSETNLADVGLTGGKTSDGTYVTMAEVRFTVPKGASGGKVGQLLEDAQLVESKEIFQSALEKSKKANSILVGTFTIPAGSTVEDIVNILTK